MTLLLHVLSRPSRAVAAALGLFAFAFAVGCNEPRPIAVPPGLDLEGLTPAQRSLLRVVVDLGDGVEHRLVLARDARTIMGDFEPTNTGQQGERTATLRVYGRLSAERAEVILGEAQDTVFVSKGTTAFLDFADSHFETCGAADDGVCSLRFDDNRNGIANIDDLANAIDPARAQAFLEAPDTLQFPSGMRPGDVARQALVIDNVGENPVRIDGVRVAGGQGVGVALYRENESAIAAPRRVLSEEQLGTGFVVMPGEEAFVALSFSPANDFLTAASILVTATDTVTQVRQGVRTRILANPDGALRPRRANYEDPTATELATPTGALTALPFPSAELFSGIEVVGLDNPETDGREEARLPYQKTILEVNDAQGRRLRIPSDAAFVVDVGAGERFTASLSGLVPDGDIDLSVLDIADDNSLTLVEAPRLAGDSAEAVEFLNGTTPRRVAVVLGRIEPSVPVAIEAGLAADEGAPFSLACQVTKGPEFVDDAPVVPVAGSLGGGLPVTLRGTGFFVPDDVVAGPHVTVTFEGMPAPGVPRVTPPDADGLQILSLVLPPGTAAVADRAVVVTVENPLSVAGQNGDGQAATLPAGFRYDLPSPRVTSVVPAVASTDGGGPILLTGAFFFDTYGPPVVRFGDVDVAAEFVDAATLRVQPPAHEPGEVELTVANQNAGSRIGEASPPRSFVFLAPLLDAPVLRQVMPSSGSSEGGEEVTLQGTDFADPAVFLGAVQAEVVRWSSTEVVVQTPPSTSSGAVDVIVQNGVDGQTSRVADGFVYELPRPRVDSVFPRRVRQDGGTPMVVDGAGFRLDVEVDYADGDTRLPAAAFTVVSSGRMIVTPPPFPATETARLVVTNTAGESAEMAIAFFAPQGPPPRIVAIDPEEVSVHGGDIVTVVGSDFSSDAVDLVVGTTTLLDVDVDVGPRGLAQVQFLMPPLASGPLLVTVLNEDGQSDSIVLTVVDVGEPRVLASSPTTLHAELRGDIVFFWGENLSLLGPANGLTATAVVTTAPRLPPGEAELPEDGEDGDGATLPAAVVHRVPLAVVGLGDTVGQLRVDEKLVPGDVVVELSGQGRTLFAPGLVARRPDVHRVENDVLSNVSGTSVGAELTVVGRHLAGDRMASILISSDPTNVACDVVAGDDELVFCAVRADSLADNPVLRDPLQATLVYENGDQVDDGIEFVVRREDGKAEASYPVLTDVPSVVWGEPLSIRGENFTTATAFTVAYAGDGAVAVAQTLPVTFVSGNRVDASTRVQGPGEWVVCLVGGGCRNVTVASPESELEPNDDLHQATGMIADVAIEGVLDVEDVDTFFLDAGPNGGVALVEVRFLVEGCAPARLDAVHVVNDRREPLITNFAFGSCAGQTVSFPAPLRLGRVELRLSVSSDAFLPYLLKVARSGPSPLCGNGLIDAGETCEGESNTCINCREQDDDNDNMDRAAFTPYDNPTVPLVRWLAPTTDADWFRFPTPSPSPPRIRGVFHVRPVGSPGSCPPGAVVVGGSGIALPVPPAGDCAALAVDMEPQDILVGVVAQSLSAPLRYELAFESPRAYLVNDVEDSLPTIAGDGSCTLREALFAAANEEVHPDCGGSALDRRIVLPEGDVTVPTRLSLPAGVTLVGKGRGDDDAASRTVLVAAEGHFDVVATQGEQATPARLENLVLQGVENRAVAITGSAAVQLQGVRARGNASVVAVSGLVRIVDSIFENNVAQTGGIIDVGGAGAEIEDSIFVANRTPSDGGAVRSLAGHLSVRSSQFWDNQAAGDGGAIAAFATMTVADSVFVGNSAGRGGALFLGLTPNDVTPRIVTRSHLQGNVARVSGGGIHAENTLGLVSSAVIANRVDSPEHPQEGRGGGVALVDAHLFASAVTVAHNEAAHGGGLSLPDTHVHKLKDSIVSPNLARSGLDEHDCAGWSVTSSGPADADVTYEGMNLLVSADHCTQQGDANERRIADPALTYVPEPSLAVFGSTSAAALLALFAPRPSPVVVDETLVNAGTCTDVDDNVLGFDLTSAPRPSTGCTLGATEFQTPGVENTIVVNLETDDDSVGGCNLRNALRAAHENRAVSGCAAGTTGLDRVVFASGIFGVGGAPAITLSAFRGPLEVKSEVIIDAIAGRDTAKPIEVRGIAQDSPVLLVRAPTRSQGLVWQGGAADGSPAIFIDGASLRLDETTVRSSEAINEGALEGGAVQVLGGTRGALTLERSSIDGIRAQSGSGVDVYEGSRLFGRRVTLASAERTVLRVRPGAFAQLTHATLLIALDTPPVHNEGLLTLKASLIFSPGQACVGSTGLLRSQGTNVFFDPEGECGAAHPNDVLAEEPVVATLSLELFHDGGRTPTVPVNGRVVVNQGEIQERTLDNIAQCAQGESDQRGFPPEGLPAGPCTVGAVQFNPEPVCGDGFVDRLAPEGEYCDPVNTFGDDCNDQCTPPVQ
jgi:hypothetical protein